MIFHSYLFMLLINTPPASVSRMPVPEKLREDIHDQSIAKTRNNQANPQLKYRRVLHPLIQEVKGFLKNGRVEFSKLPLSCNMSAEFGSNSNALVKSEMAW